MNRIVIIMLFVVGAFTTAAADRTEDARKYFDGGRQAYEAGQYAAAISSFEEAYRLAPRSSIMFALAQSYRRQYSVDRDGTKLIRAGELYRTYLAEVKQGERRDEAARYLGEIEPLLLKIEGERAISNTPPPAAAPQPTQIMISSQVKGARGSINGGPMSEVPVIADVTPGPHNVRVEADGYFPVTLDATAVESRLVVAEGKLVEKPASLVVTAARGALIIVDGKTAGAAPLATPLTLPAGRHFIAVNRRGSRGWSSEVTLGRGESQTLDATLVQTTQRKVAYGVLIGAGTLALAAGVAGIVNLQARSDASSLQEKIDTGMGSVMDLAEHNRLASKADRSATATHVLLGGAFAVGAAGVLLYFLDVPRVEESPIVPTFGAGGGGAAYLRRF